MERRSHVIDQSIVIPIRNEEDTVGLLVARIHGALREYGSTEVIFVDDSDHVQGVTAIASVQNELCNGDCHHIRLRHMYRTGLRRHGGLSGAVVDGVAAARSDNVIVMDGDLQHPPETIPAMLDQLADNDLVAASRYIQGGKSDGLSGPVRHLVSLGSTALVKILFPIRLRGISDPMTGFFAVRKSAIRLDRLRPQGFKILVEILLAHPNIRRSEVPFDFAKRETGESKGDISQGIQFFTQLLRHRISLKSENSLSGAKVMDIDGTLRGTSISDGEA